MFNEAPNSRTEKNHLDSNASKPVDWMVDSGAKITDVAEVLVPIPVANHMINCKMTIDSDSQSAILYPNVETS